jgi:hypothetical protein
MHLRRKVNIPILHPHVLRTYFWKCVERLEHIYESMLWQRTNQFVPKMAFAMHMTACRLRESELRH